MPKMTGVVETPETPQTPNNYIQQQLATTTDPKKLRELLAHARAHGYSDQGQTVKAILAKIKGGQK